MAVYSTFHTTAYLTLRNRVIAAGSNPGWAATENMTVPSGPMLKGGMLHLRVIDSELVNLSSAMISSANPQCVSLQHHYHHKLRRGNVPLIQYIHDLR